MIKIISILVFLAINVFSFDLLTYKDLKTQNKMTQYWNENTLWMNRVTHKNNIEIIMMLKNISEFEAQKKAKESSNNIFIQLKNLSKIIATHDIMLYDLSTDNKLRRLLKQEMILCLMYINNYIEPAKFHKRLLSVATKIKNYDESKLKKERTLVLFKDSINKIFKTIQMIEAKTNLKKLQPEEITNLIKG